MGTTRTVAKNQEWLRCQHTIRKMFLHLGRDPLIYAKGALEHEDSEPERLKIFWENARKFFDSYEMKAAPKATPAPKAAPAPKATPTPKEEPPEEAIPEKTGEMPQFDPKKGS